MDEVKMVYDFLMLENPITDEMNTYPCKYMNDLIPKFINTKINGFISHGQYGIIFSSEYENNESVIKLMTDPQNTLLSVQKEFEIGKEFNSVGVGPEMYNYGYKIVEDSILLHFISMSMIDSQYPMKAYFQNEERTEYEISNLMGKLFDILDVLRDSNLVHGDLHLNNVILFENKDITLVDFGLSIKCKTFYVIDAIRIITSNHLEVPNPNRDIIDRIARQKTKQIFNVSFPEFTTVGTNEIDHKTAENLREKEDKNMILAMK